MTPQVSGVAHLSPREQDLFATLGFGDAVDVPFQCVHHAFEHYASVQPEAIAVEHLGSSITYRQLNRSANRLAAELRIMGVSRGACVCILAQRSIQLVVGILATLKAGACYVPLDGSIVTQPTLEHVITDSGSLMVLALDEYHHRVRGVPVISLDHRVIPDDNYVYSKPRNESQATDSVYIIYTSGTTGKPKGVEVMHGNVTNLVCLSPGNVGMAPGRRVAQLLNIAFDMAAWEILGSMCNGCTLYPRQNVKRVESCHEGGRYRDRDSVNDGPADYPNIQVVATAGDVCPQNLADSWAERTTFYNCCGPTEITIVNTVQRHIKGTKLNIGKPTPNNNVYVLGEDMRPLPIGEVGVMWAGGVGISKGYVNLAEKTNERYHLDTFANDGSYMFNTGDLGRWSEDGTLEHLGRVDDQVKVKGFRVELDGVAAAMETCPDVTVAAALLIDAQLWGFVTPANVEVKDVLAAAAKVQPYYAVPTQVIALEQFPYTGETSCLRSSRAAKPHRNDCRNDKTDKRALRQLALDRLACEKASIVAGKENIRPISVSLLTKGSAVIKNAPWVDLSADLPALPGAYLAYPTIKKLPSLPLSEFSSASGSSPDARSRSLSIIEKGNAWDGYEKDPIPDKTQGHYVRNFRHRIFTLYRRLFGIVFVTNMAVFIATLISGNTSSQHVGLVVVANLFCAILMRQDYVINAFFNTFCAAPTSWPLSIRRVCARVYHIGGLHSGCAISGVVWHVLFTVQANREAVTGGPASIPTVVVSYCILFLLLGIVVLAYPRFRTVFHNRFEASHRFLGWTATGFVWALIVLLINDYRGPKQALGHAVVRAASFWLVLIMTLSIALPWVRLRKVPVRAVVLSSHAVRIYFDYVTPIAGSFTRISDNPLLEWHGFATVPEPGKEGYSLVVSKAGDWTSKQIAQPPKELWVRGIPTFGVLRIVPLFRRVVFVATGSGIGPCAPCILEQRVPIRLLWTSPNVRETFGDELVDAILEKSPGAVVYDTRKHGKPDMVKLTYRLVREFEAEAVCIISNQKLTRKVVYGMMSRGIPAFGAIWDS